MPANYSDQQDKINQTIYGICRNNLIDFIKFTMPEYDIKWFHELICKKLDTLYSGDIKKLMIFMPPQHGKSEIVSRRFPAYALGRNPDLKIAVCSYSADLAAKINRQVQRIIDDDSYRILFPDTMLNTKNVVSDSHQNYLRNSDEFEIVNYAGGLKTVGVGGPLTGNPVDIAIIDDPVKDAVEGQSATDRARKWEWYCEVLSTRLHNDSKILLTMTRWHEDDMAGKILAHEKDWTVIKLPYFRETLENEDDTRAIGQVLWPEKHNAEKGEQAKRNNSRTFAALYQQRPAPLEGGIFRRHWWKYYDRLPERISKLVMSWDCAFKGEDKSDYVVGMVLATSGINTYIVDLVRGRYDFPETVRQIQELCRKYPYCQEKYIEEKANGAAVIATLKERIPGLIPIVPKESKEARANAITYRVEGGNVFIPAFVPWKDSFLYEFSVFPNGANDDIVDAFTQAMNRLHNASHGQALRIAI